MAEYIEREEAIRMLRGSAIEKYPLSFSSGILASAYVLENLPAADVAPVRHGQWEKWNGDDRHHCTVCECYANAERDSCGYIAYEFLDNYCPNCGARMDLEEPNEAKESRQP